MLLNSTTTVRGFDATSSTAPAPATPPASARDHRPRTDSAERSSARSHAERVVAQLRWDPRIEPMRASLVVVYMRERRERIRGVNRAREAEPSEKARPAWSERMVREPCEESFVTFLSGGAQLGADAAAAAADPDGTSRLPPYHLLVEVRHGSHIVWAERWGDDVVQLPPIDATAGSSLGGAGVVAALPGSADAAAAAAATTAAAAATASTAASPTSDPSASAGATTATAPPPAPPVRVSADVLPDEVWELILRRLPARELTCLARSCARLRRLTAAPELWRGEYHRVFGEQPEPRVGAAALRATLRASEAPLAPWLMPPRFSGSSGACAADDDAQPAVALATTPPQARASPTPASNAPASSSSTHRGQPVRALCHDGSNLLATADGGAVRLWEVSSGRRVCSLKSATNRDLVHAGGVSALAVKGTMLLSGGGDGLLHAFDLDELTPVASLRGHAAPIFSALLLHDAAVSSAVDGAVNLWPDLLRDGLATRHQLLPSLADAAPGPTPVAALPDDRLACGRGGRVLLYDLAVGTVLATAVPPPRDEEEDDDDAAAMVAAAAADASPLLATASLGAGCVHVWDPRLMPAPPPLDNPPPLLARGAARRALVLTLPLPAGCHTARHLQLGGGGALLLAAADAGRGREPLSRVAGSLCAYDLRGARGGARERLAAAASVGALWEAAAPSGLSCMELVEAAGGPTLSLGTCVGGAGVLEARGGGGGVGGAVRWLGGSEGGSGGAPARRAKTRTGPPKVRGRFPKTQGFSNAARSR